MRSDLQSTALRPQHSKLAPTHKTCDMNIALEHTWYSAAWSPANCPQFHTWMRFSGLTLKPLFSRARSNDFFSAGTTARSGITVMFNKVLQLTMPLLHCRLVRAPDIDILSLAAIRAARCGDGGCLSILHRVPGPGRS